MTVSDLQQIRARRDDGHDYASFEVWTKPEGGEWELINKVSRLTEGEATTSAAYLQRGGKLAEVRYLGKVW